MNILGLLSLSLFAVAAGGIASLAIQRDSPSISGRALKITKGKRANYGHLGRKEKDSINVSVASISMVSTDPNANQSSSEVFSPGAMCSGRFKRINVHAVHIPKAGGSSLACTFTNKAPKHTCSNDARTSKITSFTFQGVHHENYQEIVESSLKCDGHVYEE